MSRLIDDHSLSDLKRLYCDYHKNHNKSTCVARKVTSLIMLRDKETYFFGYNHSLTEPCNTKFRKISGKYYRPGNLLNNQGYPGYWVCCKDQEEHNKWSLLNEIHAEQDVIGQMCQVGMTVELNTAFIISTYSPCFNCAKLIAQAKIPEVYYFKNYEGLKEVKEFFDKLNIHMEKIK